MHRVQVNMPKLVLEVEFEHLEHSDGGEIKVKAAWFTGMGPQRDRVDVLAALNDEERAEVFKACWGAVEVEYPDPVKAE